MAGRHSLGILARRPGMTLPAGQHPIDGFPHPNPFVPPLAVLAMLPADSSPPKVTRHYVNCDQ